MSPRQTPAKPRQAAPVPATGPGAWSVDAPWSDGSVDASWSARSRGLIREQFVGLESEGVAELVDVEVGDRAGSG